MREKVAGGRDKSVLEWRKKMSLGVENKREGEERIRNSSSKGTTRETETNTVKL